MDPFYDGLNVILERNKKGKTLVAYTRGLSNGGGVGGIINMTKYPSGNKSKAKTYYYEYDGSGNVISLTDSTGKVVQTYTYDAYGNLLSRKGSVQNRYMFSTKEFSSRSGLYYFGARYYDPKVGRWLSKDPLGMIDGPNMYLYCLNNPVNFIDPFGFCKKLPWYWFLTEGYENWTSDPETWYWHGNYGGANNPKNILDISPSSMPNPIDTLDKWGYKQHDIDYAHARQAGSFSGQALQQSTADFKLAGKTLSQAWRYDTGLHGQLHGTLAGAWFPIQGTAQLIASGIIYITGR